MSTINFDPRVAKALADRARGELRVAKNRELRALAVKAEIAAAKRAELDDWVTKVILPCAVSLVVLMLIALAF